MATYKIVPEADIIGGELSQPFLQMAFSTCRRMCDDEDDCAAFVWHDEDGGTCVMKQTQDFSPSSQKGIMTYVKKDNSNYAMTWVSIAAFSLLAFFVLCPRK